MIAPGHAGNWCSHRVLPESELVAVPDEVPPALVSAILDARRKQD